MITIEQARKIVLENIHTLKPEISPASSTVIGSILSEDISADMDSPPFDKATMDGFALTIRDLESSPRGLKIGKEISASQGDPIVAESGIAYPIMTGAQIPLGSDIVIPREESFVENGMVRFQQTQPPKGWNIFPKGMEFQKGQVLVRKGTRLNAQRMAVLAACGKTSVMAFPSPRVSIFSTGNEIVEPNMVPKPGQIRNTNASLLVASCSTYRALPKYLGIAQDTSDRISALLEEAVSSDMVIICGGVSAGKYDLVPDILKNHGITIHVHKINLKPGKPFLFGTTKNGIPVFGLPGNPASVFACFHLFARPAIQALRGNPPGKFLSSARITEQFTSKSDRRSCHPVQLNNQDGVSHATPLNWKGSPDLLGLANADGLMILPEGETNLNPGDLVTVLKTNHPASH